VSSVNYDVIVVGGGIAGCGCAARLADRGKRVLVLDRGPLAGGASGRNQGGLLPSPVPECGSLFAESMAYYRELDTDVSFQFRPHGYLLVAADAEEMSRARDHGKALSVAGCPSTDLGPADLRALEPDLAPDLAGAVAIDGAHAVHPVLTAVALGAVVRRAGGDVRTGVGVRGLKVSGSRVTGVLTDTGVVSAGAVVLAAGPWTRSLALQAGVDVPVSGSRGWLVRTAPAARSFRHTMMQSTWHGGLSGHTLPTLAQYADPDAHAANAKVIFSLQPLPTGEVVLGSSSSNAIQIGPGHGAVTGAISRAALRFAPTLGEVPVRSAWSGVRPVTPDGLPIAGPAPGADGLWIATGYGIDGMPLAPVVGRLLATAIIDGAIEPALRPFDPGRF